VQEHPVFEHHQRAIDTLVADLEEDPSIIGVIVAGSVGRGSARADSDVDVYLVATEDEYQRRRAAGNLAYFASADYPGGYIDGKVISLDVLRSAVERGTEPMRASFLGAFAATSSVSDLQDLVDRIGVYPERSRSTNMQDFYAAASLHASYFGPQAIHKDDPFLLAHATSHSVLFAGRAVLAFNRTLYPCPKQLVNVLEATRDVPPLFVECSRGLLQHPSNERFADYHAALRDFTDWGIDDAAVLTRFMELDEWRWLASEPELAQR
jgi:hypothetical protein